MRRARPVRARSARAPASLVAQSLVAQSLVAQLLVALALVACGEAAPRFGESELSSSAPRLTLSGTTFGVSPALELAPGCPGYLDAEIPGHTVHVTEALPFTVQARSTSGPLALAVAHGDEVRCDSDEGSGHTPTLSFDQPGDYLVYVAALRQPAELPYELSLRASVDGAPTDDFEPAAGGPTRDVSVTLTSQPLGAQITDAEGRVVGTTPSMFVATVPVDELGASRSWTLSFPGHESTTVSGVLREGALVLHAQLPVIGPTEIAVTADVAQPIRDYRSAALAVEVGESCALTEAEVAADIRHTFIGDLRVVLRPPDGPEIILHRHGGGGRRNLAQTWRSSGSDPRLASLVGRDTRGRWTLLVHDDAGADEGSLERFDLHLTCDPSAAGREPSPAEVAARPSSEVVAPPRPSPRPSPAPSPRLPDLPTRTDIVRVLASLRPRVESCGSAGGNVRVLATVAGATGRVGEVSSGGGASPAERQCVERIVRTARFPRFRRDDLDVDYTYDLPAQPQRTGGQIF